MQRKRYQSFFHPVTFQKSVSLRQTQAMVRKTSHFLSRQLSDDNNPASSAIKVSQISTHHASAFRLASLSILAPKRRKRYPHPIPTEKTYLHTCICELLHSEFTEIRHKNNISIHPQLPAQRLMHKYRIQEVILPASA